MTTGSVLYLLLSIAMFVVFAVVLAYESWQQARLGPEVVPVPEPGTQDEPHDALHA